MLELYNDREHTFTCDVKIEGSTFSKATPRLVLVSGNKNLFFEGKINAGKCEIVVPPVSDINSEGKVSLELVVDSALLKPWESKYKIVSSIKTEAVDPKLYTKQLVESKTNKLKKRKSDIPKVLFETPKKASTLFKENVSKSNRTIVGDLLTIFRTLEKEDRELVKEIAREYNPSKKTLRWAKSTFKDVNRIEAKICMYEIEQYLQEPEKPKKSVQARDEAIPPKKSEKPKEYKKEDPKNKDVSKPDRRVMSQRIQSKQAKTEEKSKYRRLVESNKPAVDIESEIHLVLRRKKKPVQKKKKSDLYRRMLMV